MLEWSTPQAPAQSRFLSLRTAGALLVPCGLVQNWPIFFKEISFFDFLEESTQILIWAVVEMWEGKIEEQDLSFLK
jgi:hypothetical protein